MHLDFFSIDIYLGVFQHFFSTLLLTAVCWVWTENSALIHVHPWAPSYCRAVYCRYNTHGVILWARWMRDDTTYMYSSCSAYSTCSILHSIQTCKNTFKACNTSCSHIIVSCHQLLNIYNVYINIFTKVKFTYKHFDTRKILLNMNLE